MREVARWLCCLLLLACGPRFRAAETPRTRPNLILIICDDLGWGDLACYGHKTHRTPHLDRLAAGGVRFTDFYAAGIQCTPSRAGMLTGRYPVRFGLTFSLMTDAGVGIPAAEITLPEALRQAGYTTMLSGKWHLGDQPKFHPTRHGFDRFFGLLRGHDTQPRELWRDTKVIERETPVDALTRRYTDQAVQFISQKHDRGPFFLMLAHTAPHVPLAATYAQAVKEIDDSVGQIVTALEQSGREGDTLILFTSDNGPAIDQGRAGGSTGPLRAGKYSTFEGGIRVPAIAYWKGKIAPRVETRPAILLDVFPTFVQLAAGKPPADRPIDGKDLSPLLLSNKPRDGDEFFFHFQDELRACRAGKWKLNLPEKADAAPMLFDLESDPAETKDLAASRGDVVADLRGRMKRFHESAAP